MSSESKDSAQTAKKTRKLDELNFADGRKPLKALPFGAARRVLPTDIEALAFGFLELADLAHLFFSSKELARTVALQFKTMRVLRCNLQMVTRGRSEEPDCFGFLLAARFCSSLTMLDGKLGDTEYSAHLQTLLAQLIKRNQKSLRIVRPGVFCDELVFDAIVSCPLLEEFSDECADTEGWAEAQDYDGFQGVMASVTATRLPRLRSLTLCNNHCSVDDETKRILSQPFPLTVLDITFHNDELVSLLAAPHLQRLQTLCVWSRALPTLAASISRSLTRLELFVPYSESAGSATFELPSLRHFVLRLQRDAKERCRHAKSFPTLRAPTLQTLDVSIIRNDALVARAFEACLCASELTVIRIDVELNMFYAPPQADDRDYIKRQFGRFVSAVVSQSKWPGLLELHYNGPCSAVRLLAILLARKPSRPLRSLECLMATCDQQQTVDLLAAHPALTSLRLPFAAQKFDEPLLVRTASYVASELVSLHLGFVTDSLFCACHFPALRELHLGPQPGLRLLSSLAVLFNACPRLEVLSIDEAAVKSLSVSKQCNTLRSLNYSGSSSILMCFSGCFNSSRTYALWISSSAK